MAKAKAKSKVKTKSSAKKPAAKKTAAKKSAAKKPAMKAAPKKAASSAPKSAPKKAAVMVAPKSKTPAPKSASKATPPKAVAPTPWADFFTPIGNRLLIEREEAPTKTAGGLFIPDFAQEKPNHAVVLVAGPGGRSKTGRLQPLDVQIGDRVLLTSYAGMPIKLQGHDLVLVKEDDIQAILP